MQHIHAREPASQGSVSGHASFLHRGSGRLARCGMAVADSLMAMFGWLLRAGGRPLRKALIRAFGAIAFRLMPGKRRVARINVDLVFGQDYSDAEKDRIVRAMFDHFSRAMLDFLFDRILWPHQRLADAMTPEAHARLAELTAQGQGSAVISCHLGNPELLLRLLTHSGYDGYAIYKGFRGAWFDRYVGRKRLRAGCGVIEVPASRHRMESGQPVRLGADSLRQEIDAIWSRGEGLGFMADQYARRGCVNTTVLGVPDTPTQIGAWRYVVERRIPFLLHVAVYRPDGGLEWHCSDIFRIEDQGGEQQTLMYYLQQASEWFEAMIRRYPEQYAWGHRRFARHYYKSAKASVAPQQT